MKSMPRHSKLLEWLHANIWWMSIQIQKSTQSSPRYSLYTQRPIYLGIKINQKQKVPDKNIELLQNLGLHELTEKGASWVMDNLSNLHINNWYEGIDPLKPFFMHICFYMTFFPCFTKNSTTTTTHFRTSSRSWSRGRSWTCFCFCDSFYLFFWFLFLLLFYHALLYYYHVKSQRFRLAKYEPI